MAATQAPKLVEKKTHLNENTETEVTAVENSVEVDGTGVHRDHVDLNVGECLSTGGESSSQNDITLPVSVTHVETSEESGGKKEINEAAELIEQLNDVCTAPIERERMRGNVELRAETLNVDESHETKDVRKSDEHQEEKKRGLKYVNF